MKAKGVLQYLSDETNKLNYENQNGMQTIKSLVGLHKNARNAIVNYRSKEHDKSGTNKRSRVVTADEIKQAMNREMM